MHLQFCCFVFKIFFPFNSNKPMNSQNTEDLQREKPFNLFVLSKEIN